MVNRMVIKCPYCGADVEYSANATSCTCGYCSSNIQLNWQNQTNTQQNMQSNPQNMQYGQPNMQRGPQNMYGAKPKKNDTAIIIIVIACVVLFRLLCFFGGALIGSSSNAESSSDRPSRNGFRSSDTRTVNADNFTFEIPSYFERVEMDDETDLRYCVKDDSDGIELRFYYRDRDPEEPSYTEEAGLEKFKNEWEERYGKVYESEIRSYGIMTGSWFYATTEGTDGKGSDRYGYLAERKDHPEEVLQFVLLIPEDRKYDYYDDFIRILESVKEK